MVVPVPLVTWGCTGARRDCTVCAPRGRVAWVAL